MNRLTLALKSEARYMYFLAFLAICQIVLPFAGAYTAIFTFGSIPIALAALYGMWKMEEKEISPSAAYREFVTLLGAKVPKRVKTQPIGVYGLRKAHA